MKFLINEVVTKMYFFLGKYLKRCKIFDKASQK